MAVVIVAVTFKGVPLFRVTEVTPTLCQAKTTFEIISIYIPGLGLVAVVIAVTFKCVPLFRVTAAAYLVPSKDDL